MRARVTGLIRDSICVNSQASFGVAAGLFGPTDATGTLRNVTAIAEGVNGRALFVSSTQPGADILIDGYNVIAQGATDTSGMSDAAGTAHIDLHSSNFDSFDFTGSGERHGQRREQQSGHAAGLDAELPPASRLA